jgi:RNA polymerase subunit RPABC4/transcription elongation factor Spt4
MGIFSNLIKNVVGVQNEVIENKDNEDDDIIAGRQRKVSRTGGRTSEDDPNEDYESGPMYQGEIAPEDFSRRFENGELDEGDIYKIRGEFFNIVNNSICFDDVTHGFNLVWSAPKLKDGQRVAFYCEVTDANTPLFLRAEGKPCNKCGAMMDAGAEFCPSCGEKTAKDFCANCGAALEGGEKSCAKCGAQLYKEIDLAEFITHCFSDDFANDSAKGTMQRFQSIVRYHSIDDEFIYFSHPEKINTVLGLNIVRTPPNIVSGQKMRIFCTFTGELSHFYTDTGPNRLENTLDDVQVLPAEGPLPQPPAGYDEIDFDEFVRNCNLRSYKKVCRFWSRVMYRNNNSNKAYFVNPTGNGNSFDFDMKSPLPEMEEGQAIIIMYTVLSSVSAILDSAILYDMWLMPPPASVSETYEEIDLGTFVARKKSLLGGKKFKSLVRISLLENSRIRFVSPEKFDSEQKFEMTEEFDRDKLSSALKFQKVVICYTTGGSTSAFDLPLLDSAELLPLPKPPAEYEEIDLTDFYLGMKQNKFEAGKKFGSHARYKNSGVDSAEFWFIDNNSALVFSLTKRLPKMDPPMPVVLLYQATMDASRRVILDDVLI